MLEHFSAICTVCSRPVLTKGYQVDGRWYHPACFVCAHCGTRIERKYVDHHGKYYHPGCVEERLAPRCDVCGGRIEGRHIVQSRKTYHQDCFREHVAPRCAGCGKPLMGKYVIDADRNYHPSCHARHIGLRCSVTGRLIRGTHYRDEWGHVYSSQVYGAYPHCTYCGRLMHRRIAGKGVRYPDGRSVCSFCRKAVLSPRRQQERLDVVLKRLRAHGIYVSLNRIPVGFVDRRKMREALRLRRQNKERSGLFIHPAKWHENGECRLLLLTGMPAEYLDGALAHELFHVWQWQNCRQEPAAYLSEGSAVYAAYLIHREQETEYGRFLLRQLEQNPDPHYGEGFRRVRRFVEEHGLGSLLERMEWFKTLPRGC